LLPERPATKGRGDRDSSLKMKFFFVALIFTVPFLTLADSRSFVAYRSQALQQGLISPKLEPGSDKVFFGEDYPDNRQPREKKIKPEFGHPYPALQDTDRFDKDEVKEENSDNGEWKAQMDYDLLRTRVSKDKDDVEKAKAAEEDLKQIYDNAKAEETAAGKRAEKAEERAAKAREEAKKAQEDVAAAKELTEKAAEHQAAEEQRQAAERAEKQAGGDGKQTQDAAESESGADGEKGATFKDSADKIAEAAAKIKKEMSDLEKCQHELADARARLRELMAKEQELARQRREQKELEKAGWEEKLAALAREEAKAAAALAEHEREAADKRGQEKVQEDTLSSRKAAHKVADEQYKEEKTDYDVLYSELKKSEQNLRKFRRNEDAGGGVSNSDQPAGQTQMFGGRSGASHSGICAAVTALIVVMFM